MTKTSILQIAGFVLLVIAAIIAGYFLLRHIDKMQNRIIEIEGRKAQLINVDSIKSAVERRVLDSLKVMLQEHDAKIDALKKDIKQTRRKNEALEKRFNDIRVTLPDF